MTSRHDKLVDKVRKLLALAESSNEHEVAAAAARAAALMTEHQIAEASLVSGVGDDPPGEHVLDEGKRIVSWKSVLAGGVCAGAGCAAYAHIRREDGTRTVQTMIVGRAGDVDTARYMYAYLVKEVDRLATAAWRSRHSHARAMESARAWKNGFRAGAAAEVARRLRASRDSAMASARGRAAGDDATRDALVRMDAQAEAVKDYLARLELRRVRRRARVDASGMQHGQQAGRSVNLGSNSELVEPTRRLGSG